ncbi:MAG: aminoacetone oxidase family FAD-binding enzyme [Eubacteriaceae bacterium]|nr:aminoacetone oxidase family FAD-binding enzyme [Eubacteriaceae bacterium]
MYDICIIGAGAAGLTAAVTCARRDPSLKICILEKNDRPAKKIYATGSGRCNITNHRCAGLPETAEFFSSIGVVMIEEDGGRYYPMSGKAEDVAYALITAARNAGVVIKCGHAADNIAGTDGGFAVSGTASGGSGGSFEIKAKKVLIASGGKAAPEFGTTGDGYIMARKLGHTVARLVPVLTGITTPDAVPELKGVRAYGRCTLLKFGRPVCEEVGEVQFTDGALSGICIMNLSRYLKTQGGGREEIKKELAGYSICIDFMSSMRRDAMVSLFSERKKIPGMTVDDMLVSIVPRALGRDILRRTFAETKGSAAEMTFEDIEKLTDAVKSWTARVIGAKGWKDAQCTSGGVSIDEIDTETMMSKLVSGLYFAGEVTDFDGPCGGFNLQNAWETGITAGKAMAE